MDSQSIVLQREITDVLILTVFLTVLLYWLAKNRVEKRILTFGNYETLKKAYGSRIRFLGWGLVLLRLAAVSLFVLAYANPQTVTVRPAPTSDFVLAIDTSSSMLTPDYNPNRLEATKETAVKWLSTLEGVNVGVVTFAGRAYIRLKPTNDFAEIMSTIQDINLDTPAGTAIGDALVASSALLSKSQTNRTIILITDGRNNIGVSINDSLQLLQQNNMKVVAIGIGTIGGQDNTTTTVPSELARFNATVASFADLDVDTLQYLANATNGTFNYVEDVSSLQQVLFGSTENVEVKRSLANYFFFPALVLLLLDWSFEATRYRPVP
ncbi:von Willebrand factor type A domain protein [uncultured archaeon]|nr:von Willebrand factor type A domain protein [uncultured archaeon]